MSNTSSKKRNCETRAPANSAEREENKKTEPNESAKHNQKGLKQRQTSDNTNQIIWQIT